MIEILAKYVMKFKMNIEEKSGSLLTLSIILPLGNLLIVL